MTVQYAPDGGRRWVARSIDPTGAVLGGQYAGVDAAGNFYSASAGFRIEKHSPTGRFLWRRTDADSTRDMTVDAEGNVYAIARGFSHFPEALFAVKYDPCGNRRWSYLYDTNAPAVEIGTGIALAPGGRIYLSGLLIPSAFGQHPASGLLLALSETAEPLPPPVSIRATRRLTSESSRWPPPAMFTIVREAAGEELAVHLTITGTATPGGDYRAIPDTIIIPAGQTSVAIPVEAINDRLSEKTETVRVELAPNLAYSLCGQTRATAYILDNEPKRR